MSRNLPDKYLYNSVSDYKLPRSQLLLSADFSKDEETLNLSYSPFSPLLPAGPATGST